MPKQPTDHLFQLVKSLSKSEKRNFKLYVNRLKSREGTKFLQLFDILDKQEEYDEGQILGKASSIKQQQLSNLKAHLYKQLLKSLRLKHLASDPEIGIRESIDYARVLYSKGLYRQALRVLEKSKDQARAKNKNLLHMEIVEFEKVIEMQYITRSLENRADELIEEAGEVAGRINSARRYSNLALKLYSLYLKVGSARNKKDMLMVSSFFNSHFDTPRDINQCGFYEKLHIYQSYVWYYYIIQDFLMCYKYASKWVELFRQNRKMIGLQTDMYLKGMNNLLGALHMLRYHTKFEEELEHLRGLISDPDFPFNDNNLMLYYMFTYLHSINHHFLEGTFTEGLELVDDINQFIGDYSRKLDPYRVMLFYYKIASLYFGSGDFRSALRYENYVLNYRDVSIRGDIHSFARLLNLVTHFELGNDELVEYQVKSTYRFLFRMENLQEVQRCILDFLRRLGHIGRDELKSEFRRLHDKLVSLESNPFEKRAFLYLDIISWLESKLQERPVQDIIREKAIRERQSPGS
jgi:tetratricopeptide (TPR) repeat protein